MSACVSIMFSAGVLVKGGWWQLGQGVHQHALNALKHSEGVLVCIHMLTPTVALHKLLHTAVVELQPL